MADRVITLRAVSTPEQAKNEKASLDEQARVLSELAARNGWQIVDDIEVPGFSRDFYTYQEFCNAAARASKPILSPRRMWDHWERSDFDILIAVTLSRMGRDSVLIELINRTIDCGARLYSVEGGWIEKGNHRLTGGLAYILASLENDEKTRRHHFGMDKRVERGLPPGAVKWTHRPVTNDRGKVVRIELREDLRRMFDDIYDLLIHEKQPYYGFEIALAERGHWRKDGKPFSQGTIYAMLHHPLTYGHISLRSSRTVQKDAVSPGGNYGRWAYRAEPPPPNAIVYWNAAPAVWPPDQEAAIIAEVERRRFVRGKSTPRTAHWYTSLFVCSECGSVLGLNSKHYRTPYLRCQGRYYKPPTCTQINALPAEECRQYVAEFLLRVIERGGLPASDERPDTTTATLAQLDAEIAQVTTELDTLIATQGRAGMAAASRYQARIDTLADQLDTLEQRKSAVLAASQGDQTRRDQEVVAIRTIAEFGDAFWQLPEPEINQHLHRLFGGWRIAVDRGAIIGLVRLA